jgi:hypothetical protein
MRDLVPSLVFDSIRSHLRTATEQAVAGWEANREEEDSLTGDLGRVLTTPGTVETYVNGQVWRWRIAYKKFRGRGDGAFESESGADGIIQIEAMLREATWFKGILFQAKKATRFRAAEVREQIASMEKMAPGGSAVVLYDPEGYRAIKATEFLHSEEGVVGKPISRMLPLGSFFEDFLECKNGLRGMYYEAVRERLLLPSLGGDIRAIPLQLRHRVKIEVVGG